MDYAFKLYLWSKNEKNLCISRIGNKIVLCSMRLKSFTQIMGNPELNCILIKKKVRYLLCINLIEFLIVVCSYSPDNPEVLEKTVWQDRSMPGMRDRRWRLINWRERQAEHRTDPAPLRDNVPATDKQQWHRRRAAGSRPDIGESILLYHLIKQLKFWVHIFVNDH